jgi:hypothetical protein
MHSINFDAWKDFFTAAVSATSALTGLVFVALSINLSRILAMPGMSARGGEALVLLGGALLMAMTALIPGQQADVLQIKMGVVDVSVWLFPTLIHVGAGRARHYQKTWQFLLRTALHQLATLPYVVAAMLLPSAPEAAINFLASGLVTSLSVGLFTAWILLVEIVR